VDAISRTRPGFDLSAEALEGVVVMRMSGELDLATAPLLREAVDWLSRRTTAAPLVLDLARVSFIDSTGVRLLMEAGDAAAGRAALLAPSQAVSRVLELTGLRDRFAEVADADPETLRALAGTGG
jgi:anti-sigma B factor antagonist